MPGQTQQQNHQRGRRRARRDRRQRPAARPARIDFRSPTNNLSSQHPRGRERYHDRVIRSNTVSPRNVRTRFPRLSASVPPTVHEHNSRLHPDVIKGWEAVIAVLRRVQREIEELATRIDRVAPSADHISWDLPTSTIVVQPGICPPCVHGISDVAPALHRYQVRNNLPESDPVHFPTPSPDPSRLQYISNEHQRPQISDSGPLAASGSDHNNSLRPIPAPARPLTFSEAIQRDLAATRTHSNGHDSNTTCRVTATPAQLCEIARSLDRPRAHYPSQHNQSPDYPTTWSGINPDTEPRMGYGYTNPSHHFDRFNQFAPPNTTTSSPSHTVGPPSNQNQNQNQTPAQQPYQGIGTGTVANTNANIRSSPFGFQPSTNPTDPSNTAANNNGSTDQVNL